jgi:hypothetical protein
MVNSVGDTLGAGLSVRWRGRDYNLSLITQAVKADCESWLKSKAIREVAVLKNDLPAADYSEMMVRTIRDAQSGKFELGGERWTDAISSFSAQMEFFRILLKHGGNPLSEEDAVTLLVEESEAVGVVAGLIAEMSAYPKPRGSLKNRNQTA